MDMHQCRHTCSSTHSKHTARRTNPFRTARRPSRVAVYISRRLNAGQGLHVHCVLDDTREPEQPGQSTSCSEVLVPSNDVGPVQSLAAPESNGAEHQVPTSLEESQEGQSADGEHRQQEPQPCSFHIHHSSSPKPVQLPPADASPEAAAVKSYFWKAKYRPPGFLQHYPCRKGAAYNYVSFLGSADPHGGKYFVPQQKQEAFLESYFNTLHHLSRRLHIAECYNDNPYKYFQELDFPWSLDVNLVLALIPRVVQIVTEETCRIHRHIGPLPEPFISMRTPYKVHLSYPSIITVAAVAGNLVRKTVINRCRVELSGQDELQLLKEELQTQQQLQEAQQALHQLQEIMQQLEAAGHVMGPGACKLFQEMQHPHDEGQQPQQQSVTAQRLPPSESESSFAELDAAEGVPVAGQVAGAGDIDWESIIDFPHGSLRLLGSCKAPWMDTDPDWVTEKYYSQVKCVDGVWMRQPLTLAAIQQCSILPSAMEQRLYEQSEDFLEASYQSVKIREQLLRAKSILRRSNKYLTCLQNLQAALQDGDSTAATAMLQDAYKYFLLVKPNSQQKEQQQHSHADRQPQQHSIQPIADAPHQEDAAEQQRRKQEALERLIRLQGTTAAVHQQGPRLIRRPLGES